MKPLKEPTPTTNLTNCDREPIIHIIGHIQPHGALLVVDVISFKIMQQSKNLVSFLQLDFSQKTDHISDVLPQDFILQAKKRN